MSPVRATGNSRLSVDDWIEAGYSILAEAGIKQLKIDTLCAKMGATKGSFYWHFADINAYRSALVDSWGELRDEDRRYFENVGDLPPRERLFAMMKALVSPRHWTLERAMREWARSDPAAAAGVRAADRRVMRAVKQAFLDYGFTEAESELRAETTFAAGIGLLHLSGRSPSSKWTRSDREWFLNFMLRD